MKKQIPKDILHSFVMVAITLAAVVVCELFSIKNPNIILFTVISVILVQKGYIAGVASSLVVFVYLCYFLSYEHDFITYAPDSIKKLIVIVIGILVNIVIIGHMHTKNEKMLEKLRVLNERLSNEKAVLETISRTDTLTQLQNRYAFRQNYDSFINRSIFIMIFDIDYFKQFNDQYGHDMGDCVLKTVAEYMMELFGEKHCYRWGGDEFLIVVSEPVEEIAKRKIQGLQFKLQHHSIKGLDIPVGITCGYVIGKVESDVQVREMLEWADQNLYKAKEQQRGTRL